VISFWQDYEVTVTAIYFLLVKFKTSLNGSNLSYIVCELGGVVLGGLGVVPYR
jgi:hypothetical protein